MTDMGEEIKKEHRIEFEHGSPESDYVAGRRKSISTLIVMLVLLFLAMAAALSLGAIDIPFLDTVKILLNKVTGGLFGPPSEDYDTSVILKIRMPRILLCMLTGLSLGLSGAVMQGLLRNPLVSPFTLGVSTAASFGAALAIVFGTSLLGTSAYYATFTLLGQTITLDEMMKTIMAFVVGLASIGIVLGLTRRSSVSRSTLILSGVIISYIFQSFADDEVICEIVGPVVALLLDILLAFAFHQFLRYLGNRKRTAAAAAA